MPTIMIGGTKTQYGKGVSYETIAKDFQHKYKNRIALVYFNRKMRELNRKVTGDGVLTFITTGESSGFKAYSRTASMMLVKALSNIMGERSRDVRLKFEFSLGNASYCTVIGDVNVDDQLADQLTEEMKRLRDRNIPIIKKTYPIDDAIELFRRQGMKDKEKLFQYRRSSTINVYNMDGYYDYFYGYMLPSTGYVELFRVQAYEGGLLLILPTQDNPNELEEWHEQKSLFDQLIMGTRWGDLVDISTVGDLNEQICAGNISDMILVQEALQERRIGDIAEMIHERSSVKIVMVAGPSSSGKTTFAHRLAIQLRSFGMKPHIISMDNYFVNREKTPLDADGNYNFECLEALDLELFEDDMCDLLEGEEIEMPTFDFRSGRRVYKGNTMQLGPQDVLIIEGIHGLNPRTTQELPQEAIFKVYISALTSLNVDEHNRIGSTDVRLIRRMIRDARTRGNSAKATIGMWKKVRDGEEEYIFPYQSNADVVFNSVLIYELSILKHFAEPLLFNIRQNEPEYYEAKRLLKFLDYFVGVDTEAVPKNSLCREFVGGGCFPL
ncbi:MAG: nucleoside kinase [Lachnospiraceae bacterium]|nr:nucleoside kinase [Lachnospiraceae bacterium]